LRRPRGCSGGFAAALRRRWLGDFLGAQRHECAMTVSGALTSLMEPEKRYRRWRAWPADHQLGDIHREPSGISSGRHSISMARVITRAARPAP